MVGDLVVREVGRGNLPFATRKAEDLAVVVLAEASPELSKMLGLHGST